MAKRKVRIMEGGKMRRIIRKIFPNRQVRDRLFKAAFAEKKYMLELYNALNNSNYTDPNELEIYTMEDVIYLKMKNDVSFLIGSTLNLYEHQSTYNPNMPLRGILYMARQLETYVNEHKENIYGTKLIKLPTPQYVVFYNGEDEMPEEEELLLSEAFERKDIEPALECRVRVLNIKYGHNRELMNKCGRLEQYAHFIALLEHYRKEERNVVNAVEKAVNQGREEGLLLDILTRQKVEVYSMLLTEYNEKKHMRQTYEEGVREGIREGTELGAEQKLEEQVRKKLARGKSVEEIAEDLEETVENIQRLVQKLK